MIKLIWAMDENRLIGIGNKLPWHVKEDLLYYKNKTNNQTVLMGENTYYSLKSYYKSRPLPYGKIYIASLNTNLQIDEAIMVNDLDSFFQTIAEDIFVVGGLAIYNVALKYANKLYISIIKGSHQGDVYFPTFDLDKYNLVEENETIQVRYLVYERS